MQRQYCRVLKFTKWFRLLEGINYIQFKDTKALHFYRQDSYPGDGRDRPRYGQPEPAFSSLFSYHKNILSSKNGNKYFSQQNVKAENVADDKSDKTSTGTLSTSSIPAHVKAQDEVCIDSDRPYQMNQSELFEDVNYDEITDGDEEKLNEFRLLMLEIDVMRQDGMNVPSKLKTEEWKELLFLQSRSQRRKFLDYLFKTEMKKLADKRKKELKRLAKLERSDKDFVDSDHLKYGFRGSTIFLRIYEQTINLHDNWKLMQAMMFGQDLVIDCGFYNDMNRMENKLCCKQIVYLFSENRLGKEPFNIHFCNLKKHSFFYELLRKCIPTIEDPAFPINIHDEHYLDLFPKQKLVYLTPHCRTELKEFNHDDIYIVGAIVDRVNQQPLTLAKAKSEGLRMAHLPLDRYLDWGLGNKSLTINQVVNILHDQRITGDWVTALKHVPQRKIKQPGEPNKDPRKPWNRGTTFQPPQRFKKYY